MIIGCDVDGVIADLHIEWMRLYNEEWNDSFTLDRWISWDIHKLVKPECGKRMYDYLSLPYLYHGVSPTDGSIEGTQVLKELGHRIVYITTNAKGMTDPKWDWLERWKFLPENNLAQSDLIVSGDKTLFRIDALIDDKAETVQSWNEQGNSNGLLFDRPWNQHITVPVRVKTWSDIIEYFKYKEKMNA